VKYISALDMHFNRMKKLGFRKNYYCIFFLCSVLFILYSDLCFAELIDRVAAYVDDTAITYSEFKKRYLKVKETVPAVTEEEVINSMINGLLLLKEAKKMRLEAPTDDDLLKGYIDIKIKSSIVIKEDKISAFYKEHAAEFGGKDYFSVRDDIEKYLIELETNVQLKAHLEELRANTEIKIQLKDR
jgi:hypothetical protein